MSMLANLDMFLLFVAPALASVPVARMLVYYFQLSSYQFAGYAGTLKRQWWRALWPGVALAVICFGLTALMGPVRDARPSLSLPYALLATVLMVLVGYGLGVLVYQKKRRIRPMVFTHRLQRLVVSLAMTLVALALILWRLVPVMGVSLVFPLLLPLWVALAAALVWPVEKFGQWLYKRDAKKRLEAQKDLIIVGITGSYGKTTVKYILQSILGQKYGVLFSKSSINTPMGLTRVIRSELSPGHRVFIAEMGARHVGDIKEICRFIRPDIGVLTAIGDQHLETFGHIDNVAKAKYELIANLKPGGLGIFSSDKGITDKAKVEALYEQTQGPKMLVGSKTGDLWAEDVVLTNEGSRFTLCLKDARRMACSASLPGEHNVRNILLAAAVALALKVPLPLIKKGIELAEPVPYRFKVDNRSDGITVINNAFNANPEGSKRSLRMLEGYAGRHIVVTPGFVELGKQEAEYNRALGRDIAAVAHTVLLVGPKHTRPIAQGLKDAGFPNERLHVFKSLAQANAWLKDNQQTGDVILYENDLPDHYSEA